MTSNTTNRGTSRKRTIIITVVVAAVLAVGAFTFALTRGYFGGDQVAHPPCEQLPDVATVRRSLTDHADLARQLRAQGAGITVEVGTPCRGNDHAALIEVNYANKNERTAIDHILTTTDGFGVPVYLAKR